jgi:hypothetical protein
MVHLIWEMDTGTPASIDTSEWLKPQRKNVQDSTGLEQGVVIRYYYGGHGTPWS